MKTNLVLVGVAMIAALLPATAHSSRTTVADVGTNLEIPFVANCGQLDAEILYHANIFCGSVALLDEGKLLYDIRDNRGDDTTSGVVLHELFLRSNDLSVSGEGPSTVRVSTFTGNDPNQWRRNLPVFEAIRMQEVWDGIDITLKARGNSVEKIFRVGTRATVDDIRIRLLGGDNLAVLDSGELEVRTALGSMRFSKPVAFQVVGDETRYVEAAYRIAGEPNTYCLTVGDYDRLAPLYIDPLIGSTYLGGGAAELFVTNRDHQGCAIDENGDVYITGETASLNFPTTPGAYQVESAGGDGESFVCKLDGALTSLYASTYIGGKQGDYSSDLVIDAAGNICIAGFTLSDDFPTTSGAYDQTYNDNEFGQGDAFVSILSSDLDELIASTFLGGELSERFNHTRLAIDETGNIFVGGGTLSWDFPVTPGCYLPGLHDGANDLFVSKFSSDLSTLMASTLFGGYGWDQLTDIQIDDRNNVCFCGSTGADDFPIAPTAYIKEFQGDADAFVSVLDNDLEQLVASTYLGWLAGETAYAMARDSEGSYYVCGRTGSWGFPTTPNAFDTSYNGGQFDSFVSVLDRDLESLIASTFLGGAQWDDAMDILIDELEDAVFVTGQTRGEGFPTTPGAYDTSHNGRTDAYIARFSRNLEFLEAATYLGGESYDFGLDVHMTADGNILTVGNTASQKFPTTPGAYDETANGDYDAYVTVIDRDLSAATVAVESDLAIAGADQTALFPTRPNPLTRTASIRYRVMEAGHVRLGIFDVQGREVALLVDGMQDRGEYEIAFDATEHGLAKGVYVCRLQTGGSIHNWKLVLMD